MPAAPGSLTIVDARVVTMDASGPSDLGPEVEGIAIVDGRVAVVGTRDEVLAATADGTPVLEARGSTVLPGLIDSHLHPLWGARLTAGVDLGGLTDPEAVRAALAAQAGRTPAGAWVRGWNLDYAVFADRPMHRSFLDDATGGRPTLCMTYDLHTALASTSALEAAGIDGPRAFGDASSIVTDEDGAPTGELREPTAYGLAVDAAPEPSLDEDADRLRVCMAQFAATGLVGSAVMDGSERLLDVLERIEEGGELSMRFDVHLWHRPEDDDAVVERTIALAARAGRRWRVAGIKLFSDGVVETGTAWLGEADTHGVGTASFWPDWRRFREVIARYDAAGLQLATHAIGDAAVSAVLDAYAELPPAPRERPRRIEHLEVLTDDVLAKLAGSGVVASMQPLHMQWRRDDLGDSWATRLGADRTVQTAFRAHDVLAAGVPVVLGSDWPVAPFDPRIGLAWAVARHAPGVGESPVFEPAQRLSIEQALVASTRAAGLAIGASDRGVLRPGAVGDVVMFKGDPRAVEPERLPALQVYLTVVDGHVVHDNIG